jgi:hypothetical protein
MNKAHFEVLGFTVPSRAYTFHDDGYVSSITDATMRVNELYNLDNSNYDASADKNVIGRHCKRGLNSHIFYFQRPTRASDVQNRSHEETHVLEHIGQLDALTDRLSEEQNVKINLKDVDDEEVRAQLGSLYALNARGFGGMWALWKLKSAYENDTFTTAKTIYEQAKQPKKRFFVF